MILFTTHDHVALRHTIAALQRNVDRTGDVHLKRIIGNLRKLLV